MASARSGRRHPLPSIRRPSDSEAARLPSQFRNRAPRLLEQIRHPEIRLPAIAAGDRLLEVTPKR
jgi:hypothetical protein